MPLIAEVPGKQLSFYVEEGTRERIGIKLKMKRAEKKKYLNIGQKSKSTVKAKFVIGVNSFLSRNAFAQRKAGRRDVFVVVPPCFNKELLLGMPLQHRVALFLTQSF